MYNEMKNALAAGQTVEIEYQKLDGTSRPMRLTLAPTEAGVSIADQVQWDSASMIHAYDLIVNAWRSVRREGVRFLKLEDGTEYA